MNTDDAQAWKLNRNLYKSMMFALMYGSFITPHEARRMLSMRDIGWELAIDDAVAAVMA